METGIWIFCAAWAVAAVTPSQAALVAQYAFNGSADDQSGLGNHGTVMNGATYSNDTPFASGSSLSLGNGGQHVLVPHNASLNMTQAMTVTAWVKHAGVAFQDLLAKGASNTGSGNYEVRLMHLDMNIFYHGTFAGPISVPAAWIGANQWTHMAITVTQSGNAPGEASFYKNGILIETRGTGLISPQDVNTSPLYIGNRADLSMQWQGLVDDLRIYSNVLSADEIRRIATIPEPGTIALACLALLGIGRRR